MNGYGTLTVVQSYTYGASYTTQGKALIFNKNFPRNVSGGRVGHGGLSPWVLE